MNGSSPVPRSVFLWWPAWVVGVALTAGQAWAVQPPPASEIPRVRSKKLEVHFQTRDPSSIKAVGLWFTQDDGRTWKQYAFDTAPRRSPLPFIAPQEGRYGFYVIVRNAVGASSEPPESGTKPQQWAFVDWHAPLVQLEIARKADDFHTSRTIALRWTAHDAYLTDRPIDLYYMVWGQRVWNPIELRLPDSGRYDWKVPEQLGGEVVVKIAVSDRGGHVVERFSDRIRIKPVVRGPAAASTQPVEAPAPKHALANEPLSTVVTPESVAAPTDRPESVTASRREAKAADASSSERRARSSVAKTPKPKPPSVDGVNVRDEPAKTTSDRGPAPVRSRGPSGNRQASKRASAPQASARASGPTSRPTTVAAAVVASHPPVGKIGSVPESPDAPSKADLERAEKLYRAATYYRLRGQSGQPNDLALAVLRYQQALEANPRLADARLDLAGVLLLQGKAEQASRLYTQLLAQSPGHREALRGMALTMIQRNQYDAAKDYLMRLVGVAPNNAEGWLDLGDLCHRRGEIDAARAHWRKAATVQPGAQDVAHRARQRLKTYRPLSLTSP